MPDTIVYHLQRVKSDHCPLAIWWGKDKVSKPCRPFRFLSSWLSHYGFGQFVNDNWRNYAMVEESVKKFIETSNKWNREVFGNILKKKRTILARLSGIQKSMENYRSRKLVDLERKLQVKMERVLDNEEMLWKQKSHCNWLMLGDRNTKYFHSQANNRRRVNQINALKLEDGM
ncbi:hypothetical protein PVK06_046690 [Gossypium arboreum]|uniref:Reverse transcriptase n=1 Tax=Gossypium arboreum TaxID=29729 RepID=A0ABR0MDX5_GOSAR|nr:hypothetical protein PVK06_046690 [Gossypium arboreum]